MTKPTGKPRGRPRSPPRDRGEVVDPILGSQRDLPPGSRPDVRIARAGENLRLLGMTPLDVMLAAMRKAWNAAEYLDDIVRARRSNEGGEDGWETKEYEEQRWEYLEIASFNAARAAPYIHPKLVAVAHRKVASPSKVDVSVLTPDDRKLLLGWIRRGLIKPADPGEIEGTATDESKDE